MLRPWMFLVFLFVFSSFSQARKASEVDLYYDEETGLKSMPADATQPEPDVTSPVELPPQTRPRQQPSGLVTGRVIRTDPGLPTPELDGVGVPQPTGPNSSLMNQHIPRYPGTGCGAHRYANEAPIWPKFVHSFSKNAPNCSPGVWATFGCRGRRKSGRLSCHQKGGNAIDVKFIDCGGQTHEPGSSQFLAFVQKMRDEVYDGPGSSRVNDWVVLHRQTGRGCSHITQEYFEKQMRKPVNKRHYSITKCHWDHAHFDLKCY